MVWKITTKGFNISGLLGIGAVLVILLVAWVFTDGGPNMTTLPVISDQGRPSIPQPPGVTTDPELLDETLPTEEESGSFGQYDERYIASLPAESRVILFFTATSCNACQRAETSFLTNQAAIPPDVHIFLVDHTTSPVLRREYDVSVPHTFVEITTQGTFVQRWRASRDLQAILARL